MRIDDGAKLGRCLEVGHQIRRHDWRHGEDDGIRARRQPLVAEIERHHLVTVEIEGAQPVPERDLHVVLAEKAQRRLDEDLPESVAGDQRSASLPSRHQCFAHDGAGEARAPLLRLDVERREPERPRETLVERAGAFHGFAHGFFAGGVQQPCKRKVIARGRARHAPVAIKNPPWHTPTVDAQRPALAACKIDEGKLGRRRTVKPARGADRLEIGQRGMIAREQKVIAVVDHHIKQRVMVGPAAPSSRPGSLVHDDACPASCKTHGRS